MGQNHGTSKENGGLAKETHLLQAFIIPRFCRVCLNDLILAVDMTGVAVNHVHLRFCLKHRLHLLEGTGQIDVIGIDPGNDITCGCRDALVDGGSLPSVGFADPSQAIPVGFENVSGLCCRRRRSCNQRTPPPG